MGAQSVYTTTMTSGNSLATFDLGQSWHYLYGVIPTMASSTAIEVWASVDAGTTYYQVRQAVAQTATAQMPSFVVAASCAIGGSIVPLPSGFQYLRLRTADSAPTAATTFRIIALANY